MRSQNPKLAYLVIYIFEMHQRTNQMKYNNELNPECTISSFGFLMKAMNNENKQTWSLHFKLLF